MDAVDAIAVLEEEGAGPPRRWGNAPGDRYDRHDHPYHKVLFCLEGSITFHLADRDVELGPGDRLDLPAGTPHAATVGPSGCECIEGYLDT
jgi:quercetin dioxygenase-like cupin family protein